LNLREQHGPCDHQYERRNAERGSAFAEQRDAGGDRHCVREQRGKADCRDGPATLEAKLKADEREPVCREQCGNEDEPPARGRLRRDVPSCVQHTGRGTERCTRAKRRRARGDNRRAAEPHYYCKRGATAPAGRVSQRGSEEDKASDRNRNTRPFPPGQPLRNEQREDADPARRGRLHKRERSECECADVEHPAAQPAEESDDPPSICEERPKRQERSPECERRQSGRRAVLGDVAPVERERRCQSENERKREPHRWNGKYASAASAASETRGRSRRRS
jgi:hypothetical protein